MEAEARENRTDTIENICTSVDDKDIDEWLARNERIHHMAEQTATHDWHTRAWVRIRETTTKHSHDGEHTFQAGEIVVMFQWGRAGRSVDRDAWWTSYDIDGAWIVEASLVEVVEVLDEVSPFDQEEPTLRECPYCHQMHQADLVEACPLKPKQGNGSISV